MTSPAVWTDASARVIAAAGPVPVQLPNVAPVDQGALWLQVEISGSSSDRLELDGMIWLETGQVMVHVQVASGSGVDAGLALRKQIAGAFRFAVGMPAGLTYRATDYDPGDSQGGGDWFRLSLHVHYEYQDKPINS